MKKGKNTYWFIQLLYKWNLIFSLWSFYNHKTYYLGHILTHTICFQWHIILLIIDVCRYILNWHWARAQFSTDLMLGQIFWDYFVFKDSVSTVILHMCYGSLDMSLALFQSPHLLLHSDNNKVCVFNTLTTGY